MKAAAFEINIILTQLTPFAASQACESQHSEHRKQG
jgi:hypothetical protein